MQEEIRLFAFLLGIVAAGVIGWCAHWLLAPHIENYRMLLKIRRLQQDRRRLIRKLDASRAAYKAMESSLAICHRERDVANDAAAQLITLTQQATDSIAALAERIDPTGDGNSTEPL